MKKYKKGWGKLFQARMTEEEYRETLSFIEQRNLTRRQFILDAKDK